MSGAAEAWQELGEAVAKLTRLLAQVDSRVQSSGTRELARKTAQLYFRETRPSLAELNLGSEIAALDNSFKDILQFVEGRTSKQLYNSRLRMFRQLAPAISAQIEMARGAGKSETSLSKEDERIIETLEGLVPSSALSFQQAISDLGDERRISFRGPALELREALRETLDHLAPDKDVTAAPGYVQEKDRRGPTMKQKVKFIRSARGLSKSSGAVSEQSVALVDEILGTLTRSVYELSSVATHVSRERADVIRLKRYIVAVLHDILMI